MIQVRVSGKQIEIGEALPEYVRSKLAGAIEKHFDGLTEGHVTFAHEGPGVRADCFLHLGSGAALQSQGDGADAYAAFDAALTRLEKQVGRHIERLKERRHEGLRGMADGEAGTE